MNLEILKNVQMQRDTSYVANCNSTRFQSRRVTGNGDDGFVFIPLQRRHHASLNDQLDDDDAASFVLSQRV